MADATLPDWVVQKSHGFRRLGCLRLGPIRFRPQALMSVWQPSTRRSAWSQHSNIATGTRLEKTEPGMR